MLQNLRLRYLNHPYLISWLGGLLILVYLISELFEKETGRIDSSVYSLMLKIRTPELNQAMIWISNMGEKGGLAALAFLIIILIWQKHTKIALIALASFFGSIAVMYTLKNILARPRPELVNRLMAETSYSFPSGHSTIAFTIYPMILLTLLHFETKTLRVNKNLVPIKIFLISFPFLVAFSRLYLGVHYFSDVLAGGLIGLFFASLYNYWISKMGLIEKSILEKV